MFYLFSVLLLAVVVIATASMRRKGTMTPGVQLATVLFMVVLVAAVVGVHLWKATPHAG